MTTFDIISFADDEKLADAAANQCLKEFEAAKNTASPYCVALSGGRIARRFFAALANLAKEKDLPLNSIHFFWSDERCVPPNDPESNFVLAREFLLAPLNIPEPQI